MKNVCVVEQYHTGTLTFRLWICSSLKKNADLAGWATPGVDYKFDLFSEFKFIFEMALGYGSGDWGTCFDLKNQRQNF
jgi:hypothetical protein